MGIIDILTTVFLLGAGLVLLTVSIYRNAVRSLRKRTGAVSYAEASADGCERCIVTCSTGRETDEECGRNGTHILSDGG